ncbi:MULTISPECIES: prohead protease/major capsid protein fusion protein [Roseomonadaceae]|uniref:Terminase n=1 Tax=Falsiroseomonas oleicola TaxID=2801474 RepID=A0ABS6H6B9_9PROT|nr:prohead protease/major capsid protein fusion protein [Roseomonas oleicola]MBU8543989.1 terminase [Roseomonas oleicola]
MPEAQAAPEGAVLTRRAPRAGDNAVRLLADAALAFAPASYNADTGEVDVVWSTGAAVRRFDWWDGTYYDEELDLAGADLSRFQAGAPLLLDHWAEVRNLVGSIAPGSARVEGNQGTARLRFDRTSEEGQMAEAKVAAGHLRHVSIGYRVQTWEKIEAQGQVPRWIARAWIPHEVSFVPVPADAGAGTRSACGAPPQPEPTTTTRAPGAHIPEGQMPDETQTPAAPATETPEDARKAERARSAEIRKRARALNLGEPLIDEMCDSGLTVEQAAMRMTDELAKRTPAPPPANPRVEMGQDHTDPAEIRTAMAQAIAAAHQPSFKVTHARAAEYRGWRPSDMAAELLRARGERVIPKAREELADLAFGTRNMLGTTDFPLLMAAATNMMLMADYMQATPTYRRIFAQRNFNDFKEHQFLQAGDFPQLLELGEHGEIKSGAMSEKKEVVSLKTFARRISVTRKLLVNDSLGAFADFGRLIGRRVLDFENATAFAKLAENSGAGPTLLEGAAAMMTTGRGNRATSGGAIDVTTISAGRTAMMGFTSLDGLKLNIVPRILLTGPAYLTVAEQFTAAGVQPAEAAKVNPFAGRLEPVADANVTGNKWYLFAEPGQHPAFVYGYLGGQQGPMVAAGPQRGVDGFEVEVKLDFAVGGIDWRSAYFNPGA